MRRFENENEDTKRIGNALYRDFHSEKLKAEARSVMEDMVSPWRTFLIIFTVFAFLVWMWCVVETRSGYMILYGIITSVCIIAIIAIVERGTTKAPTDDEIV